jgi:hypothetical protein
MVGRAGRIAVVVVTAMVVAAGGSAPAVAAPSVDLDVVFALGSPAPPVLTSPTGWRFRSPTMAT